MNYVQLPEPKFRRGQVIIWAETDKEGKVLNGGFGKIISGAYFAMYDTNDFEWRYYTEEDGDAIIESDIINAYEEI